MGEKAPSGIICPGDEDLPRIRGFLMDIGRAEEAPPLLEQGHVQLSRNSK